MHFRAIELQHWKRGCFLPPDQWSRLRESGLLDNLPIEPNTLVAESGKRCPGLYFLRSGVLWGSAPMNSRIARVGQAYRSGDLIGVDTILGAFPELFTKLDHEEAFSGLERWTMVSRSRVEALFLPLDLFPRAARLAENLPPLVLSQFLVASYFADMVESMRRIPALSDVSSLHLPELVASGHAIRLVPLETSDQAAPPHDDEKPEQRFPTPAPGAKVKWLRINYDVVFIARGEASSRPWRKGDAQETAPPSGPDCLCPLIPGTLLIGRGRSDDVLYAAGENEVTLLRIAAVDLARRDSRDSYGAEMLNKLHPGVDMVTKLYPHIWPAQAAGAAPAIIALVGEDSEIHKSLGWIARLLAPMIQSEPGLGRTRLIQSEPGSGEKNEDIVVCVFTVAKVKGPEVLRDDIMLASGPLDVLNELIARHDAPQIILLDPSGLDQNEWCALAEQHQLDAEKHFNPQEGRPGDIERLGSAVSQLVFFTRDSFADLPSTRGPGQSPFRSFPMVRVVLLGGPRRRFEPAFYPRTVRLNVDLADLVGMTNIGALSTAGRATFGRLARAVLGRRIGVALGGGGAWGYAHIALLQELEGRVPIDMISGVSFGSLVAAYYAAGGVGALQQLIDEYRALSMMLAASSITSRALSWYVDNQLGGRFLQDLDVPFFPLGLNLVEPYDENTVTAGTVGWGVRTASSFPTLFSPATARGLRMVDGGMINNVPEGILSREGADIIISSNPVHPPAGAPPARGSLVAEFNPIERFRDGARTTHVLVRVADERDHYLALGTFVPPPTKVLPMNLSAGAMLCEQARPAAREFASDLRQAYRSWGWAQFVRKHGDS